MAKQTALKSGFEVNDREERKLIEVYNLPFLSVQGKRNILGGNARRVFNLDVSDRFPERSRIEERQSEPALHR